MQKERNENYKNYYISYNLYIFAFSLIGIFINLFFFSQGDYSAVLYFRLLSYIVLLLAYVLSSYLMKRYYPKYIYAFGLAISAFILIALLVLPDVFANVPVFGIMYGISFGVLFAGNNVIRYDITRKESRLSFISISNLIGDAVSFLAPTIAGILIQFSPMPGIYRYLWTFVLAGIFFVLSAVFVERIKTESEHKIDFSIQRTIIRRKEYLKFKIYSILWAFFNIPYGIILPIYVFQTTNSYLITGIFGSYLILIDMVANFKTWKGFRYGGLFSRLAVVGVALSSVLLFIPWLPAPLNVFAFAGLFTICSSALDNAVEAEYMNLLDRNKDINRAMFWVNREYYLFIGRAAALVLMLLLANTLVTNTRNFIAFFFLLVVYAIVYIIILKGDGKGAARKR